MRFRKSVARDLDPIPKRKVRRTVAAVQGLATDPRPPQAMKLAGGDKYRLRCGVYRALHEISDAAALMCVVKVAHRKDAYRG